VILDTKRKKLDMQRKKGRIFHVCSEEKWREKKKKVNRQDSKQGKGNAEGEKGKNKRIDSSKHKKRIIQLHLSDFKLKKEFKFKSNFPFFYYHHCISFVCFYRFHFLIIILI